MARNRCSIVGCKTRIISTWLTAPIAYLSSALVLAVPFINAANANVKDVASILTADISVTAVVIVGVWLLSGIISTCEKHESVLLCCLNSISLPGLLLAGLVGFQSFGG